MYTAAIVDDDVVIRDYLRDRLAEAFAAERIEMSFDSFETGEPFLKMIAEHYHFDVIFMDIEMPGLDGIEVSRRIRRLMPETLIVFISSRDELVYDTFEVRPFRFIPKSRLSSFLPSVVAALSEELHRLRHNEFRFSDAAGDIYSFSLTKIIYIEASNKSCRIVTEEGDSTVHIRFMDLESQLPKDLFLKIHRSYLVNVRYIFLIGKKTVTLLGGEEIPLSRNRVTEVKNAFLKFAKG